MDLEGIEESKVVLLVHLSRPKGQLFRPLAAAALKARYQFQGLPGSLEQLQANPVSFRHGLFRDIAIEEFNVYNDGVIATSASPTDAIDEFLDDFISWSGAELGAVPSSAEPAQRRYESALTVQMNIARDRTAPWAEIVERGIGSAMKKYGNPEPALVFGAGRLVPADGVVGVAPFLIERRVGRAQKSNLFFSSAPLKTQDHIALLRELEPHIHG